MALKAVDKWRADDAAGREPAGYIPRSDVTHHLQEDETHHVEPAAMLRGYVLVWPSEDACSWF